MYPHKGAFPPMGAPPNLVPTNMPIVGENQWMSQSAYQNNMNIDLDKVDWAALAQQWIHMKETTGVTVDDSMPSAPPPPRLSNLIPDFEEKGEAPMEVEHDDEPVAQINENTVTVTAPPPPTNIFHTNNWNSEPNSRGQHQKQWNRKGNRWNNSSNANHSKSQRIQNDGYASGQVFNNVKSTQVWATGPSSASLTNVSPFINANQTANDLRLHGLDANAKSGIQLEQIGLNAAPPLDAAQRKTLPAWIREGLEKMEREKQRQAERDREMKERDEKRRQDKLIEQNLLMQLNANESSPKLPAKSKFESDSDSDNDDTVNSDYSENMPKVRVDERTTVGSNASASANSTSSMSTVTVPTFKPHRTKAEILTEIMLSVRKNLTEILLEVTNEEIYTIAQDTLSKFRTKGRKAQSVQKNALTAIAPALGLVGYDDSDASKSDDESDSDAEGANDYRASDVDSDSELKRSIQRRKVAFENKSLEIESYLAESEEKEKNWLEQDDSVKNDGTKSPNVQMPLPVQNNQMRSNDNQDDQRNIQKLPTASKTERKGSRFSDAKALVYNVANSQLVNQPLSSQSTRQSSLERRPAVSESKKHDYDRKNDYSDESDSSTRKRSKHSTNSSKSSHHRSKRDYSRSPSNRKHKKSSRRRSSSSSSDRSSYSRHSDRSRNKRSRRERSSSDDRTSRSSQGSHKRDKHSREKSYSRSHSYKKGRH